MTTIKTRELLNSVHSVNKRVPYRSCSLGVVLALICVVFFAPSTANADTARFTSDNLKLCTQATTIFGDWLSTYGTGADNARENIFKAKKAGLTEDICREFKAYATKKDSDNAKIIKAQQEEERRIEEERLRAELEAMTWY